MSWKGYKTEAMNVAHSYRARYRLPTDKLLKLIDKEIKLSALNPDRQDLLRAAKEVLILGDFQPL